MYIDDQIGKNIDIYQKKRADVISKLEAYKQNNIDQNKKKEEIQRKIQSDREALEKLASTLLLQQNHKKIKKLIKAIHHNENKLLMLDKMTERDANGNKALQETSESLELDTRLLGYINRVKAKDPSDTENIKKRLYDSYIFSKQYRITLRKNTYKDRDKALNTKYNLLKVNKELSGLDNNNSRTEKRIQILTDRKETLELNLKKHERRVNDGNEDYKFAILLLENSLKNKKVGQIRKQLETLHYATQARNHRRDILEKVESALLKVKRKAPGIQKDTLLERETQRLNDAENDYTLTKKLLANAQQRGDVSNLKREIKQLNHGVFERNKIRRILEKEQKRALRYSLLAAKEPVGTDKKALLELRTEKHTRYTLDSKNDHQFANMLIRSAVENNNLKGLREEFNHLTARIHERNHLRRILDKEQKRALRYSLLAAKEPVGTDKKALLELRTEKHERRIVDAKDDHRFANLLLKNAAEKGTCVGLKKSFVALQNSIKERNRIRHTLEKELEITLKRKQQLRQAKEKLESHSLFKDPTILFATIAEEREFIKLQEQKDHLERRIKKHEVRSQDAKLYYEKAREILRNAEKNGNTTQLRDEFRKLKAEIRTKRKERQLEEKREQERLNTIHGMKRTVSQFKEVSIKLNNAINKYQKVTDAQTNPEKKTLLELRVKHLQLRFTDSETDRKLADNLLKKALDAGTPEAFKIFQKEISQLKKNIKQRNKLRAQIEKKERIDLKLTNQLEKLEAQLTKEIDPIKHQTLEKKKNDLINKRNNNQTALELAQNRYQNIQASIEKASKENNIEHLVNKVAKSKQGREETPKVPSLQEQIVPEKPIIPEALHAPIPTKPALNTPSTTEKALKNIGKNEIQFEVVGHYSRIASEQAILKTKDYLTKLQAQSPKVYGAITMEETKYSTYNTAKGSSEYLDTHDFKENGKLKCRITHTTEGVITATFYTNEPKYFELALRYTEHCKQQRAQLSGELGEAHQFQSPVLNIFAGSEVNSKTVLQLYRVSKLAMLKGNTINIITPDPVALFGSKNSPEYKEYAWLNTLQPDKLQESREKRESQRFITETKAPPATNSELSTTNNPIKWK